ncbi:MAG: PDZ domain-containing protein, partial [Terriglobales bacterium]
VEFYPIGHAIRVGYMRNGQPHLAELQVANRAQLFHDAAAPAVRADSVTHTTRLRAPSDLGMALETLPHGKGVSVIAVIPESFADQIGVDAGDVIVQLNRIDIHSRQQWEKLAAKLHAGSDLAMLLRRTADDGTVSRWLVGGTIPPPLENHP